MKKFEIKIFINFFAIVFALSAHGQNPTVQTSDTGRPAVQGLSANDVSTSMGLPANGLPRQVLGTTPARTGYGVGMTVGVGEGLPPHEEKPVAKELPELTVTQFQRFVQSSTGRMLPLLGYALFDRSSVPSFLNAPVPANYVLGPGDELEIKIWGGGDFQARMPIDRQGQINLPRLGPIAVAGLRASDLDAFLKRQLARVYANFDVSATVGKIRSIQVYVVGQARVPGAHTVSSLSTMLGAVFETGGPSATGSMRQIHLMRDGQKVATLDLYRFLQSGDVGNDPRLLPGDVIVIPPAGPRVALTGAVDNPAIVELATPEERLAQVMAYLGSSTALASPRKLLIERVNPQRKGAAREVLEQALDQDGMKSLLKDSDVVTLLPISPAFANAVTLRGHVAQPLRHVYRPGMRVSDLIPDVQVLLTDDYFAQKNELVQYSVTQGQMAVRNPASERKSDQAWVNHTEPGKVANRIPPTGVAPPPSKDSVEPSDESTSPKRRRIASPDINWEYASIERLEQGDLVTRLIPFNLGQAVRLKNQEHDLLLQPGDVVSVYSVQDIQVPMEKRQRLVRVSGEVQVPGIYPLKPGETLDDVLARAGGATQHAYLYGTSFVRESTRIEQQRNLDLAVRKMESQINSALSSSVQNTTNAEVAQQLQSQMAAQRASLERIRGLKASGRIGLELDPRVTRMPKLLLEDGDMIHVPARPSFVAVFGAVMADNTFIHRDGATVQDYLDKAGLARDADLEAAMLIRADGSVIANRAHSSLFGLGLSRFVSQKVYPGDSIFVPETVDKRSPYTLFIQGAKDWSQLFYQFGLGAAAIKTLRN